VRDIPAATKQHKKVFLRGKPARKSARRGWRATNQAPSKNDREKNEKSKSFRGGVGGPRVSESEGNGKRRTSKRQIRGGLKCEEGVETKRPRNIANQTVKKEETNRTKHTQTCEHIGKNTKTPCVQVIRQGKGSEDRPEPTQDLR